MITTFGSLLSDEEYAEFHIQRKSASSMDLLQHQKFISIIDANFPKDKAISILSVGSGKGDFDRHLIEALGERVRYYTCLEPLHEHITPLSENLRSVLPQEKFEIYQMVAEGFLTDRKFDVIHNVHVIHWIKDPVNTLKKLESFLLDGGLNITVLQSERGMPRLYSIFKPGEAGSLTAERLFQEMREAQMDQYHMEYVPAVLDATSIVYGEERGKKILQFVVSGKMTDEQFRQAIPAVTSIASIESEKYLIQEPFAFIMNAR